MPGESTTRLPFWTMWPGAPLEIAGPILMVGVVGFIVHLARVGFRSMFDNDHLGSTVVGMVAAVIAALVGYLGTRSLVATLRSTVLRGPCPRCGVVAVRRFERLTERWSPSIPCAVCIAYVRIDGNEMREVALETTEMIGMPYLLVAEQYLPAVKRTNRNVYKFDMPPMCAVCGGPDATHRRDIGNGDAFGTDLGALGIVASVAADVSGTPSWSSKDHVLPLVGTGPSAPSQEDKNSQGLSHLAAPVCAKHTDEAEAFGDALAYVSGKLEFASYRYYKAFCELNHIERGSTSIKVRR